MIHELLAWANDVSMERVIWDSENQEAGDIVNGPVSGLPCADRGLALRFLAWRLLAQPRRRFREILQ